MQCLEPPSKLLTDGAAVRLVAALVGLLPEAFALLKVGIKAQVAVHKLPVWYAKAISFLAHLDRLEYPGACARTG